jgi:hypothetical protein
MNRDIDNPKKYYLMLCELHLPSVHGKTVDSDPNIETHYLVYNRYDPITGISFCHLDDYQEYNTDDEYDTDDDYDDIVSGHRMIYKINNDIEYLKNIYRNNIRIQHYDNHPTIRNYYNIISKSDYIKPEIGEYIILPTQECIAILKTFWLRIIQKKWKKVFQERKEVIKQRNSLSNLSIREMRGRWPESCYNLPGLRGMLSLLK